MYSQVHLFSTLHFPHYVLIITGEKSTNPSPHSSQSPARSEESPRVHIPPHRQQHYPNLTHSSPSNANNTHSTGMSGSNGGIGVAQGLPHQLGAHLRPQSAEKRRWLERMNLLRQHSLTNPATHTTGATDTAQLMYAPTMIGGLNSDKVNRMAEADVAASQLIYSGDEKYFHIEYLEWMGPAPLQGNNSGSVTSSAENNVNPSNNLANSSGAGESGELCCPSCKNVVGGYSWNPSVK